MKTYIDCIPCFFKQAIEAARLAGASSGTQRKILNKIASSIPRISYRATPPEMGGFIYGTVCRFTKKKDPFRRIKEKSNRLALGIYPALKNKVAHSRDRLLTAVELAIAGNIIDYGIKNTLNVDEEIKRILNAEEKAIKKERARLFNYPKFRRLLKTAKTVLYIGDNTGEIVFDRILIEEIKNIYADKRIVFGVRGGPIINDALEEDARKCGIDKIAEIVSSGLGIPGTKLESCSGEFKKIFRQADMVISKGQGNFESLSDNRKKICYLFMAKCPVVAKDVKCSLGDIILLC